MVGSTYFFPGNRRSRSLVSCHYDRRSSASGEGTAAHLQDPDGSAPVRSTNSICSGKEDATATARRARQQTAAATVYGSTVVVSRATTGAPAGTTTRTTTGTESASAAATKLAVSSSAPEWSLTQGSHILAEVSPRRAADVPPSKAAPTASGVRRTTAASVHKNSMQRSDTEKLCMSGRRTEASHRLRGLKKLHVLPAGQRAESRQVFQVLKMLMKEKKIIHPCMSFRVPLETSLTTGNPCSREMSVDEAERRGTNASRDDHSQRSFVASPLSTLRVPSYSSSASLPSSACLTAALSSSNHCELSTAFSVATSPISSDSYTALLAQRSRLPSPSSSSSCAPSAAPAFPCSPTLFPSLNSSSFVSCASCCSCCSPSASCMPRGSRCSICTSRCTTYVVVDCSPASGLLTADTLVYLSGAPLQRLRRVQLMALVHPNSAQGRRAGICSYQQVFERRPDFPCLEKEDQLLLREAPAYYRDFERTVQTPDETATDAADMGERDTAAADVVTSGCGRTEGECARVAPVGDTSVSKGFSGRSGKAVEGPPKIRHAGVTHAGETKGEMAITRCADAENRASGIAARPSKQVLYALGSGTAQTGDHEQPRREEVQQFFRRKLFVKVAPRTARNQTPCCNAPEKGETEVDAFVTEFVLAPNASNKEERAVQDRFATYAGVRPLLSAASAFSSLDGTGSAAAGLGAAWSTGVASDAANSIEHFPGKSDARFPEGKAVDTAAERQGLCLNCCPTQDRTALNVCNCSFGIFTSRARTEKRSIFRSSSFSALRNDNHRSSVQRRWTSSSSLSTSGAHDSSGRNGKNSSDCCPCSSGSALDVSTTDVSSDLRNGSSASPGSSIGGKKSRSRNRAVSTNGGILPRRVSRSSSVLQKLNIGPSSGSRAMMCSSTADGVSSMRTAREFSTEASPATYWNSVEGCKGPAEQGAAGSWHCSQSALSIPDGQDKKNEGDKQQQIFHGRSAVCAPPHRVRRVSRFEQQHRQETARLKQERRVPHSGRQDDAQEVASTLRSKRGGQEAPAFKDASSSTTRGEERAAAEDAGRNPAAVSRIRAKEHARFLRCTVAAARPQEGEAGFLWCDTEVVYRNTEDGADSEGGTERTRRADKEIIFGGHTAGAVAGKLAKEDAAPAGAAVAGRDVAARGVVIPGKTVATRKPLAEGMVTTPGKSVATGETGAGETAVGGVTGRGIGRLTEREWRVRPTHDSQKVRPQRLDAETLFRYFVGPYLQRKLGRKNSTHKAHNRRENSKKGAADSRGERRRAGEAIQRKPSRTRGRPRKGEGEDQQQDLRSEGEARVTDEEDASEQKGTLVLYPGKELVIRDVTFVVWAVDPAGVPGLLDEDTVIYICLDPYGEYRRAHFVPFSDTLPTTYTFDFYEDCLKPFLLENKWRSFRRGDVFSYRGVEFKLIATEPCSSVGARVGLATLVYHEGTMQPTVMDVLPANVLNHIRRLPARMQPTAIIFAAQRLDPEVLMRVVPSSGTLRSRRGLSEQTAEILQKKLVRPFSFAAYLEKYPDLCCRISPATPKQSNEEVSLSSVPARRTGIHGEHSACLTETHTYSSDSACSLGSNCVGKQTSSAKRVLARFRDLPADKEKEALPVMSTSGASGESMESVEQCEKPASACRMRRAPSHAPHRETHVLSTEGRCGEGSFMHTQSPCNLKVEAHGGSKQKCEEDISIFERPSCTVCTLPMEEKDASILLFCGHVFHWRCIHLWLRYNSTCPNCRADITDLLQRHEDSPPWRRTHSYVEREERGGSGSGESASEEEGASWLLSAIRRVVSNALFGTVQL